MGFFDLNIPYDENSSSFGSRTIRIKVVTKVMELGYTGVAYNRTIKGVMSDHDRCSISPFTFSSLLKILPSLSSSVEFHRHVLGLPRSSPFRQYTRLTVCLNNPSEVLAINSGNLVLKTYDLVAVKPLNQHAFDQACDKLEIDIIAIDFSEKLPFRLKRSMVKSAIQRGVYFEITYANLISDVHERRQMISTTKFLVDWTRGRNLIFSSAASSANDIRGPYDVANLSSLLGISMERAKAAISKNCRTLISNALRKKQFFKDTIRVERMSLNGNFDPKEPWSEDLFKWDPISSGERDLLLDDLAKSFAASSKESNSVKAIDFTSVIDNMPPHGFQVKDVISGHELGLSLNSNRDLLKVANISELPIAENGVTQEPQPRLSRQKHCSLSGRQCKRFKSLNSLSDADKAIVQPGISVQEGPVEMDVDGVQTHNILSSRKLNVEMANGIVSSPASIRGVAVVCDNNREEKLLRMSEDASPQNEIVSSSSDIFSSAENVSMDKHLNNLASKRRENAGKYRSKWRRHQHSVFLLPFKRLTNPIAFKKKLQSSKVLMEDQKQEEAGTQITHPPLYQSVSGVISTDQKQGEAGTQITHPPLDRSHPPLD